MNLKNALKTAVVAAATTMVVETVKGFKKRREARK